MCLIGAFSFSSTLLLLLLQILLKVVKPLAGSLVPALILTGEILFAFTIFGFVVPDFLTGVVSETVLPVSEVW